MIYLEKAKKRRHGPDLEKYIRVERRYTTYREASRFYSIQYYRLVKLATKVKNIKKYLLAALFNASSTIGGYYRAEVNHDMPQFVIAK